MQMTQRQSRPPLTLPETQPTCSTRTTAQRATHAAAARQAQAQPSPASCRTQFAASSCHVKHCTTAHQLPQKTPPAALPSSPQKPNDGWGNQGRAGVAVWLPPGSYRVTQTLTITWSNVVLRGAGVSGCASPASTAGGGTAQPAVGRMQCDRCPPNVACAACPNHQASTRPPPLPAARQDAAVLPQGPAGGVRQEGGVGHQRRLHHVRW